MDKKQLRIFHISNDYPYTTVYPEIMKGIHALGFSRQTMYVPARKEFVVSAPPYYSENWDVVVSRDYDFFSRFFINRRLKTSFTNITNRVGIGGFDVIHAHYLFTGGGVARLIKKKFGIPYVCTVRGTDINFYLKLPHLRKLALNILMDADKITFLSPSQQASTLSRLGRFGGMESLLEKCKIIPNGISRKWIEGMGAPREQASPRPIKLLYVGELTRNKNWKSVVLANRYLNKAGIRSTLTIVGDGSDRSDVISESKLDNSINYMGYTSNNIELVEIYRECDIFVMPSFSESFGLSYLEAMSQGLPVIYSRNQGIDGFFMDHVIGAGVVRNSQEKKAKLIKIIFRDLNGMSKRCLNEIGQFTWDNVVKSYCETYIDCVSGMR